MERKYLKGVPFNFEEEKYIAKIFISFQEYYFVVFKNEERVTAFTLNIDPDRTADARGLYDLKQNLETDQEMGNLCRDVMRMKKFNEIRSQ